MRKLLWVFACVFTLLGAAATLELAGLQSTAGVFSHTVPADLLVALLDVIGMEIPRHGLIVGHAHGPPFLQPLGVLLIYGIPVAALAFALVRTRQRT
jgi:hypothetical protein